MVRPGKEKAWPPERKGLWLIAAFKLLKGLVLLTFLDTLTDGCYTAISRIPFQRKSSLSKSLSESRAYSLLQ